MLHRYVMRRMGNRAMAAQALGELKNEPNATNQPAPLEKFWHSALNILLLFPGSLLFAFYLLALALNLAYLNRIYYRRCKPSDIEVDQPNWRLLAAYWLRYPCCFISKATEFDCYRSVLPLVNEDALEIGVYTGETSRAFFHGRKFGSGVEYNLNRARFYKQGQTLHRKLYCADVGRLPFADGAFGSLFCVHSVDDMELPADKIVAEFGRVLRKGGRLVFSGITKNFASHNLLIRLLCSIGLTRLGHLIFQSIYIGSHNYLDRKQWKAILKRHGLKMKHYETYVPFHYSGFFDIAYRAEVWLLIVFGWPNLLRPATESAWFRHLIYRCAAAMVWLSRQPRTEEGINFFCIARKTNGPAALSSSGQPRCIQCSASLQDKLPTHVRHITCSNCGRRYPVVDGIPVLLDLYDLG